MTIAHNLSTDGLVAAEVIKGTTNANTFFDFVRGSLIPYTNPFNGSSLKSWTIAPFTTYNR